MSISPESFGLIGPTKSVSITPGSADRPPEIPPLRTTEEISNLETTGPQEILSEVADNSRHRLRRTIDNKFTRGIAISAAVLAPFAAAARGVSSEEPARVATPIAGSDLTAHLVRGSNTITLDVQNVQFKDYSPIKVGSKHFGVAVDAKASGISVTDASGKIDWQKIDTIVKEFSNLGPQERTIQKSLTDHVVENGVDRGLPIAGLELGVLAFALWQRRRRNSYGETKQRHVEEHTRVGRYIGYTLLAAMNLYQVGEVGQLYFSGNQHMEKLIADPALKGTPLENWSVTGLGQPLVDMVLPTYSDFIKDKNAFYSVRMKNYQLEAKDIPTAEFTKLPGTHRIIFADDPQGEEMPMAFVGEAAQDYHADFILLGGDATATGKSWETPVFDTLRDHAGNIPVWMNRGRHDSDEIVETAKRYKITVADNTIQNFHGVRIYGLNDPSVIDSVGRPEHLIDPAFTPDKLTKIATQEVCDPSTPPVLVTGHDYRILTPIAQTGCPASVLTGRNFNPPQPVSYANSVELIGDSVGGHGSSDGIALYGIISNPAPFYVVDLDADNRITRYKTITISPSSEFIDFGPWVTRSDIPTVSSSPAISHPSEKVQTAGHAKLQPAAAK